MTHTEQREYARITRNMKVEVRSVEGVMLEGRLRDISLNGLSLIAEKLLPTGNECEVVLIFEEALEEHERLRLPCRVARAEGALMAVEFVQLDDNQYDRLRKHLSLSEEDAEKNPPEPAGKSFKSR